MTYTLDHINDCRESWDGRAKLLIGIHLTLAVAAIVLSTFVAAFSDIVYPYVTKILAFLASVSTTLLTVLNFGVKGARFREAWRKMSAALIDFEIDKDKDLEGATKALSKEYREAEAIIGDWSLKKNGSKT